MGASGGLRARRYRLYLIGDRPGWVALTLPGLRGRLTVAPRVRTPFESRALPAHRFGQSTVFGRSGRLDSEGILLEEAAVQHVLPYDDRLQLCRYDLGGRPAPDGAYGLGCPKGHVLANDSEAEPGGSYDVLVGEYGPGPGRFGLGGNLTSHNIAGIGVDAQLSTFGIWMSFDKPARPTLEPQRAGAHTASAVRLISAHSRITRLP